MTAGLSNEGFDIDLRNAQLHERAVARLLTISTVEVKADLKVDKTGNVFIEYEQKGRPSGVAVTQATHWCIRVVNGRWVLLEVEELRKLVRLAMKDKHRCVVGGDYDRYRGVLIPVEWLVKVRGLEATPTQATMPL